MEKKSTKIILLIESLLPLLFFGAGLLAAGMKLKPPQKGGMAALSLLVFLIGLSLGGDSRLFSMLKKMKAGVLWIPFGVIAGTALGNLLASLLFPSIGLREALLTGAGYGYYSLSAIIITEQGEPLVGAVALTANMMRELLTLLGAPLIARYFTPFGPIMSGGATSMDVTLPVIVRSSGAEFASLSFISGLVLSITVPFAIAFINVLFS
jgi:uncharacterized membrane protein YbjE (DUF340 family)